RPPCSQASAVVLVPGTANREVWNGEPAELIDDLTVVTRFEVRRDLPDVNGKTPDLRSCERWRQVPRRFGERAHFVGKRHVDECGREMRHAARDFPDLVGRAGVKREQHGRSSFL